MNEQQCVTAAFVVVHHRDVWGGAAAHRSAGITPFGFDFTRSGEFVVTEAEEGIVGAATASSYSLTGPGAHDLATVSAAVPDFRSEVCWTVITKDERFAYVTNFGDERTGNIARPSRRR